MVNDFFVCVCVHAHTHAQERRGGGCYIADGNSAMYITQFTSFCLQCFYSDDFVKADT
jgi:hypothetical protein